VIGDDVEGAVAVADDRAGGWRGAVAPIDRGGEEIQRRRCGIGEGGDILRRDCVIGSGRDEGAVVEIVDHGGEVTAVNDAVVIEIAFVPAGGDGLIEVAGENGEITAVDAAAQVGIASEGIFDFDHPGGKRGDDAVGAIGIAERIGGIGGGGGADDAGAVPSAAVIATGDFGGDTGDGIGVAFVIDVEDVVGEIECAGDAGLGIEIEQGDEAIARLVGESGRGDSEVAADGEGIFVNCIDSDVDAGGDVDRPTAVDVTDVETLVGDRLDGCAGGGEAAEIDSALHLLGRVAGECATTAISARHDFFPPNAH
jgi:hypothetical protein